MSIFSVVRAVCETYYPDNDGDGHGIGELIIVNTVAMGNFHTCAIATDGTARCRGRDDKQQLGDGLAGTSDQHTPQQVTGLTDLQSIGAGGDHVCAVTSTGMVRCRGNDTQQQLGNGDSDTVDRYEPVLVTGLSDVSMVDGGGFHTCALKTDETVRCRGRDAQQALGNGNIDMTSRHTPVQVANLTGVQQISLGVNHSCALKDNGTVRCRGDDASFQLGDGDGATTDRHTPHMVTGLSDITNISVSGVHSCAVKGDGTVRCRGNDAGQQLGDGDAGTANRDTPVQVVNLTGVRYVDAGGIITFQSHSCASKIDGTIRCRGFDNLQALGNGNADTIDRHTPVQVTGMNMSAIVIAGGLHTCAIDVDGTLRCRGYDAFQQLGNGDPDTTNRHTPIEVVSFGFSFAYGGDAILSCSSVSGYVLTNTDCDDSDDTTYLGAEELCDEIDNDCDGEVDEGAIPFTFYQDSDDDGYGNVLETTEACFAPSGYTGDTTDCNDADSMIHPGAEELCDLIDNDCNGLIDDGIDCDDSDGDGIPDDAEDAGPNEGDANGDGIPDSEQMYVSTIPAPIGDESNRFTLELPGTGGCTSVSSFIGLEERDIGEPDQLSYPLGLNEFIIPCSGSVDITLYYHATTDLSKYTYMKYGPLVPGDTNTIQRYPLESVTPVTLGTAMVGDAQVGTISFTLTDGQPGDDTEADGLIIDANGPGILLESGRRSSIGENNLINGEDDEGGISESSSDIDGDLRMVDNKRVISLTPYSRPDVGNVPLQITLPDILPKTGAMCFDR